MEGFRAGLKAGLKAEKPKKPLTEKERKKLARLLAKQRASEVLY